ncbi:transcriptional regulator LysR family (plasmid) [Cupriavidus necator N-1]|uniref:Transcriptional regulator LysR family n=1 Tax=Cupriavidus necator (strain ATCC 43291 / DSM 13513 / CCUG 52238 / LMG 8453 / N-1) TaxID=1042878 RepID=F8GWQ8_CUPNN|nr:LysR family transcriptional regulator [Cupriavidus necator]AEI81778.1 transcriptional regulator LysR family [Cupriavidus necator N-1]MDX6008116.1 LysR family transcriptional regulator [Cupriavidus necator]
MKWIFIIHIVNMNLASIDLNLLVAFEALYETRNVTLAGQRLHRAQPSVSNALNRLRALFQDELFVRTAAGMLPTQRADALIPAIRQALAQIRLALEQGVKFDPANAAAQRFTIAASDYTDIVLVPFIVARLRHEAPQIDLRVARLDRAAIWQQLDDGTVDIAIGGHLAPPKRMLVTPLYDERLICIADRRHPGLPGGSLDLRAYIELPHALFVPSDDSSSRGVVDVTLAGLGLRRRVAATFAHIVALPQAVAGTDLVATLAERVAVRLAGKQVVLYPLPNRLCSTRCRQNWVIIVSA